MSNREDEVTRLLRAGAQGEDVVRDLFGLVYDELCAIAGRRMQSERSHHTLQATALVHEAYARLVGDVDMEWTSRRHFFGAAAQAMRRILVDHARHVQSQRRGGDHMRMTLSGMGLADADDPARMLEVDDALSRLENEDARVAEVVRLRFFAGLDLEKTAEALELSIRTVTRDWSFARARLHELLS
jgi:RNA polymerase sigma factor (TIGR02999 family)